MWVLSHVPGNDKSLQNHHSFRSNRFRNKFTAIEPPRVRIAFLFPFLPAEVQCTALIFIIDAEHHISPFVS